MATFGGLYYFIGCDALSRISHPKGKTGFQLSHKKIKGQYKMIWYFLILVAIVTAFVLLRCSKSEPPKIYPFQGAILNERELEFFGMLNDYRVSIMENRLLCDETACMVAMEHTTKEVIAGKAYHDMGEDAYRELEDRGAKYVQEITASGLSTVESLFNSFLRSTEHKYVMGMEQINCCGISIQESDKLYITVVFFRM